MTSNSSEHAQSIKIPMFSELNVKWVNVFSGLDMMAKRSYTGISQSILDRAREDSEHLDWLTVPYDQKIIDDDTFEWLCGMSKLLEDVVPLAEEKELKPGSSTWGEAC